VKHTGTHGTWQSASDERGSSLLLYENTQIHIPALAGALGWEGRKVSKNTVGTTGHCELTVPV